MGLWFTMVPMLTPITPIVLRYGSHFLKRGVMGLADSVTTFEMQQRPRSMKNSPVFRCPLKENTVSVILGAALMVALRRSWWRRSAQNGGVQPTAA